MRGRSAALILASLGWLLGACGGGHGGAPQDAALLDASDAGGAGEAAPTDGPGDGLPDGGGDGGGSGGDGGTGAAQRFLSETSGGARIESTSYRLELFVAPTRPIGSTQSAGYKLQLGPGGLRNAR